MGPPHEGLIRWPIAPWANDLTTELHLAPDDDDDYDYDNDDDDYGICKQIVNSISDYYKEIINLYMCVCICMYICIYMCIYVCMYVYIYIYIYIYIYT